MELVDRLRERFLVRQFQRGNPKAFLAIVKRYERRLLYYLRRFERDPHRALDVLQEVWLTAWNQRGLLRSCHTFRPWIYRIAHGTVIGAIRAELRQRRTEQERRYFSPTVEHAPTTALETAELVHFALSQVTPEHREVLMLRFLEGMTLSEIALVTNLPLGTVKSRLHYASQEIVSVIEEQEHAHK